MPSIAKESIDRIIQVALAKEIESHPCAQTIIDILNGKKFESGVMPLPHISHNLDSSLFKSPECINDLNNFHGHFYGGNYRTSGVPKIQKIPKGRTHLSILLEAKIQNKGSTNLHESLAGFSFRYLSQTPEELWKRVDFNTETKLRCSPREFGEEFRSFQGIIGRLGMRISLIKDPDLAKRFTDIAQQDLAQVNLPMLERELKGMQKYWDKHIEPKTMTLYNALIAEGYALRDFWL